MPSTPPVENPLELEVMRRALQRAHGFGLYFVRANTPVLQKQLHTWLVENLTRPMLLIRLQSDEPIVEQLQAAELGVTENAVLSVMGMDQMPKADDEGWLPRQLNWRREAFHRLKHPVLIWLPEYLLVQLMHTAPDFFDWHSGFFEFEMTQETREAIIEKEFSAWGQPLLAHNDNERRERIAILLGLLDEYEKIRTSDVVISHILTNLGMLHLESNDFRRAIVFFERAVSKDRNIGDMQGEGTDLGNLGLAHAALGEVDQAVKYYTRAVDIALEIGDKHGAGASLGNLGNAYLSLGQTNLAIDYFRQALDIAEKTNDLYGKGNLLGNIGNSFLASGDTNSALDYYKQSLDIADTTGNLLGVSNALGNLGFANVVIGNLRLGIDYYNKALNISRNVGNKRGEATALFNVAIAHQKLGELNFAKDHMHQALTLFEQIESPYAEQARRRLAEWDTEEKQGQ